MPSLFGPLRFNLALPRSLLQGKKRAYGIDLFNLKTYTVQVMSFQSHKFNEMVFQLLFSIEMGDSLEGDLVPFLMRELSVSRKTVRDAYQQARRIFDSRQELDNTISAASKGYELERIGRVERNVLRFALFDNSLPIEQTISEALRLTRKFSTKEATAYVNAVLAYCLNRALESIETEVSNGEGSALSPPKTETAE